MNGGVKGLGGEILAKVSGAAFWSYGGTLLERALRFVVFVIVARLVPPAQLGAVLVCLLSVEALQAALNVGLPSALLQQKDVSDLQVDTAFFLNLAVSAAVALLMALGAPMLATWAREPAATAPLRVLALAPLINGLGAVHVSLIQRKLGFKALAARTAMASIAASLAAVGLALAGFGIWALVARYLAAAIGGTIAAWLASSYRPRGRFDLHAIREVLSSGLRLWSSGLATLVNRRGFDLLAGLALGAAALSALRVAGQTVMLIIDLTIGPMTAVGYALLARSRQDRPRFAETLVTIGEFSGALIFPAFLGLLAVADPLMGLLFGPRWTLAAQLAPYMCAIAPALYFQLLTTCALFASGRSDRMLHWALIETAVTLGFGAIAAPFGLVALAIAGTLRMYLMTPFGWRWLKQDVGVEPARLVRAAAPSLACAAVMAGAVMLAKPWLRPLMGPGELCATLIIGGATLYLALAPVWARSPWRRFRGGAAEAAGNSPREATMVRSAVSATGLSVSMSGMKLFLPILVTTGQARVKHAAEFFRATEGDSFERTFEAFRASPQGQALLDRRPDSLALLRDRDRQAACGPGSLGRAYFEFMSARGLDEGYYFQLALDVGTRGETDPARFWFRVRHEIGHDMRHLLAGYESDLFGEICLLAFRYGQTGHKGTLAMTLLGALAVWQCPPMALIEAYRRGRGARHADLLVWEDSFDQPLHSVRAGLGLAKPRRYPTPVEADAFPTPLQIREIHTPVNARAEPIAA